MVERKASRAWMRLAGLGFELAASIAGGALLGWWIDRRLDSAPRALVALAAVGIVGGLYNLIRQALAAARELERESTGHGPRADG
ncbi:MAG: AtpZ/AtpI family protein [Thermoanaerobaculia bacterium]|nr:MAG: AtpZ/AtpI family protein [Thermoanaerobaculia bacterium]